jgi:hypothetical protein
MLSLLNLAYRSLLPPLNPAVNQAPTFATGPSIVTVLESSGAYSAPWASDISAGPGDADIGQAVTFSVTCDAAAAALFSKQPAVSTSGVLSFTPAADKSGSSKCNVTLSEEGSGGLSVTSTLTVVVTAGGYPRTLYSIDLQDSLDTPYTS